MTTRKLTIEIPVDRDTDHLFGSGAVILDAASANLLQLDRGAERLSDYVMRCIDRHCSGDFGDFGNVDGASLTLPDVQERTPFSENVLAILQGYGTITSRFTRPLVRRAVVIVTQLEDGHTPTMTKVSLPIIDTEAQE